MKAIVKSLLRLAMLVVIAVAAMAGASQPARAAGPWYVKPGGNDSNSCLSPAAACATINGALGKPGFVAGDTVRVAIGTYTGTGTQVVLLDRNVTLSGGWNTSFTQQRSTSTIDGQGARPGITVSSGVIAVVERLITQNGVASNGAGISNEGTLTLNHSVVSENIAFYGGGGIYNYGTLVLNNSTVSDNRATYTGSYGGGISTGWQTTLILNNSTVSGNTAIQGGGIDSAYTLTLNSSTISNNIAEQGGGIFWRSGTATLQNSLLAGNTAGDGPDCYGTVSSSGYNLFGNTSGCTFTPAAGDLSNLSANLGPLIGSPGYHPLLSGSPAIDAGNPLGCSGSGGPLLTDQRGAARVGRCDIGAYEYTPPGPAAGIFAFSGTPQSSPPLVAFSMPLQAVVLDAIGSPVSNTLVTFSAPATGASGTFADSGTVTTTAVSGATGVATAATFTANGLTGSYTVTATVSGVITPTSFLLGNRGWYVAFYGSDANGCQSPMAPCATINSVLAKPGFGAGDTILVATGIYTGTGDQVVLLDKSVRVLGGWSATFTVQSGMSTIDGQGARRGITLNSGVTADVERFVVQNGSSDQGGGVYNYGSLTLNGSSIRNNTSGIAGGGGIYNNGTMVVKNSSVVGNRTIAPYGDNGGGISNNGTLTIINSTITGNTSRGGGGIFNISGRLLIVQNSTISDNTATVYSGGGIRNESNPATLQNTILARNTGQSAPDCAGSVSSVGYNLVGNTAGCAFTPSTGDLTNVNANLGVLIGSPGYLPLLPGSPAINAGSPTTPGSGGNACTVTDQRGVVRVGRCDIGAYEYTIPGPAVSIMAVGGTPQSTPPLFPMAIPLQALVLDSIGSPVNNAAVAFAAPASGASGTFADSGAVTTTAVTAGSGLVTATTFTANGITGSYTVTAIVSGVITPATFWLTNMGWYVAPGGSNGNNCQTPATPCATINGALAKAGFTAADTVLVASGMYTSVITEVVLLDKSTRLLGGWNETFTMRSGTSILDGQGARRGLTVNSGVTAIVDRFVVQKGSSSQGGGIYNDGALTLNNSAISGNTASFGGGGIYNYNGTLTLNNSIVGGNTTTDSGGGGIFNYYGFLTVNNSTISGNTARGEGGGINVGNGIVTLNSSAVSGNTATNGGGIWSYGTLTLNNSTISGNIGRGIFHTNGGALNINNSTISDNVVDGMGGGLFFGYGTATLQNSIIARNSAETGSPDCAGENTITSAGYNLIGDTSDCPFSSSSGDLLNVSANLSQLIGSPGYHPLLSGSPAINAGNPSGCMGSVGLLTTDQRGASRVGRCDIGAYEYTVPGSAARLSIVDGTAQTTPPFSAFKMPFRAAVLDSIGSPVSNTLVTFSAPTSGASGTFSITGTPTTTAFSSQSGVVTAATFTANGLVGRYTVTATASGVVTPVHFSMTNFAWYAAPGGNNANDCLTPATKCATIDVVLARPGFTPGDTIFVGTGMYTGTGAEVLLLNRSVTLSGGWNAGFNARTGTTTINGQGARAGITVGYGVTAVIERFAVQNGLGGGIVDNSGGTGNLTLNDSTVTNNIGSGIQSYTALTVTNSTINSNIGDGIHHGNGIATIDNSTLSGNTGTGIYNDSYSLTLINSTVSGNTSGGITNSAGGSATVIHSTVSGNTGGGIRNSVGMLTMRNSTVNSNTTVLYGWGGGIYNDGGAVTIDNSTISGNTATNGGGIANETGAVSLYSSTIVGNRAGAGGGIRNHGALTMRNTILAGNADECFGTLNSAGYNLFGSVPSCSFTPAVGDQIDADARLGPLEGSPGYHPLLPRSPAIHAGNPAGCLGGTGVLSTDQRGFPRFGRCDIGAYELQPIGFSTKSVNLANVWPGKPLTYTVTLTNGGVSSITKVRVTDTLPISVTYVNGSLVATGGSYGQAGGVITWTGSLNAGSLVTITFSAIVSPATPLNASIINAAIISGAREIITRTAAVAIVGAKTYLPVVLRNR